MARPREYGERVASAVRFPVAMHNELHEQARARDLSVNHLVLKAVERFLVSLRAHPVGQVASPVVHTIAHDDMEAWSRGYQAGVADAERHATGAGLLLIPEGLTFGDNDDGTSDDPLLRVLDEAYGQPLVQWDPAAFVTVEPADDLPQPGEPTMDLLVNEGSPHGWPSTPRTTPRPNPSRPSRGLWDMIRGRRAT